MTATLAAIHARGIIHRDIKPSNLFLPDGDVTRVKLIDFGTAREVIQAQPLTRQGEVIGTPFYMAPEQVRGHEIGPAADVWALGCVLYECLTGRPPFAAKQPLAAMFRVIVDDPTAVDAVRAGVPAALAALIGAMLMKEPRARPISGEGLASQLAALEIDGPGRARRSIPPPAAERGVPPTLPGMLGERRVRALLFGRLGHRTKDLGGLRKLATPHGAQIEEVADGSGSLLITHVGSESSSDQAYRGAFLALALRAAEPELALALATGRTDGDRIPIGAIVDQAVAILAIAAPGEIRLDRVTAGILEGRFEIDERAGRYLLVKRRNAEATRTLLGKASPWVGRRRELNGLLATFDECVDSSVARAVLVTANPGVGKSRLVSELLRALATRGDNVEILRGQGDTVSLGSPFVMIAPAIRRSAGVYDGEPLDVRRTKLRARLSWSVAHGELDRVSGFIGELVGVPFPDDGIESLRSARTDPMLMVDLMRGAFVDWLGAECALRPVLFVLEDLHWGDAPSVSFLDAALRALHGRPIMVLAVARPEIHVAFPRLWHSRELEELRLHALAPAACAEIVRSALGTDVPDDQVTALVSRSQGNAFYLEEIVRAAADGSVDGLPDSVIGMVQARLYGLDLEARRVLRAASVFGEVFWHGGVEALVGAFDGAFGIGEWLAELVRLEVINLHPESRHPGEQEYRFRHALLRDGAYEMLIEHDRAAGHLAAGTWLAAAGESDALVLAGHFDRGNDRARAIEWLTRAAAEALEASDLPAVIDRSERAVALGADKAVLGELRGLQAIATFWLGRYRDSVTHGNEAADLLPEGSDPWFRAIGSAMVSNSRLAEQHHFDRLLQRAERTPGSGAARLVCLSRGAYQLILGGRFDWADTILAHLDATVAASIGLNALNALTIAHINDAHAIRAGMGGNLRTMLDRSTAIADAFRRAGDVNNACVSYSTLAFLMARLGNLSEAEKMYDEMLREATQLGSRQSIVTARLGHGMVYSYQRGKGSEARALLQESAAIFLAAGHARFEGWALAFLADLEHRTGDLGSSLEHAAQAVERLAGTPGMQGWALALHGRALLAHGETEAALDRVALSVAIVERLGSLLWGDALPLLVRAEALHAGGDEVAARATIAAARDRIVRYAATLEDTPWSKTILELPDAARTLALAADWEAR
ncbi:MAG: AAA family ATPase [Myxococcota bacterium]|nr:AAA family ATPase [Myxococcota bacterium]